jgi:hypothetical protein
LLWWRNFIMEGGQDARHDAAVLIAGIKLEMNVSAAIGKPVNIEWSKRDTGFVGLFSDRDLIGVYVEAEKRSQFNFRVQLQGIVNEEVLRRDFPEEFEKEYSNALNALPKSSE